MSKKYDVVAITGSYTNKNNEEKMKYKNVGVVFESDGRFYLKMDSLVTMSEEDKVINFFSLYAPKPKDAEKPKDDDTIPF